MGSSDERFSHLMFLWSLTPLVAGGCTSGDDADSSSPGTATLGSGPNTATGGDDGSGTAADGGGSATGTGGDGADTGVDDGGMTTAPATTGASGDTTSGYADGPYGTTGMIDCSMTPPPMTMNPTSQVCTDNVMHYAECYGVRYSADCVALYAAYCQAYLEMYAAMSAECGTAVEELLACLNALSCQELMSKTACMAENDAMTQACGG